MNKTVNINLSGIIFHIEEEAFDKLSKYLQTIKGYFKDTEGKDEIMSDIESRIAEMFQAKVNKVKQVIQMADVDEVIAMMGRPEEFIDNENAAQNQYDNETSGNNSDKKRFFRDPDDKILGGVCSGIASYFNIDPLWLRAGFAIAFFVFGSGLLLYILLWIIIPKARTTAEKLQMRGEDVNITNIRKSIKEDLDDIKSRAKDFKDGVSGTGNKSRFRNGVNRGLYFAGNVFENLLKAVVKVFAFLLIVFGVLLFLVFIGSLFGNTNFIYTGNDWNYDINYYSIQDIAQIFFVNNSQITWATIGLFLLFGIPLLMAIYGGIKLLFGIKQKNKTVTIITGALFLVGLIICVGIGFNIKNDFSYSSTLRQKIGLSNAHAGTVYLKSDPQDHMLNEFGDHHGNHGACDWNILSTDSEKIFIGTPIMDIVPSNTDSFELVMINVARGATKKEATARAKNINYAITQSDSTLKFDSFFKLNNEEKWRGQKTRLLLKVPVGKIIFIDKSMKNIIYDIDNISNTLDRDMVGRKWIMKEEGLTCIDCEGLEESEVIIETEFDHVTDRVIEDAEREIERANRKIEEANRKIERIHRKIEKKVNPKEAEEGEPTF